MIRKSFGKLGVVLGLEGMQNRGADDRLSVTYTLKRILDRELPLFARLSVQMYT